MPPRDHVRSTRTLHRIRTMFLPKWVTSRKPSRLYILIDPVYCGWEVLVRQGETPQQPRLPACECSPLLNAARISSSPHDVGVCQQIDMRCATAAFRPLPVPASHRRATVISRKAIRWTKLTPGNWCPSVIDKQAKATSLLGKFLVKFLSLISRHPIKLRRRTTVEYTPAATLYAFMLPEESLEIRQCFGREFFNLEGSFHSYVLSISRCLG